jgi:hypothetical protein
MTDKLAELGREIQELRARVAALEFYVKNQEEPGLLGRVAELERFAVTIGTLLEEDGPDDGEERERWMSAHQKARERRARERTGRGH